MKSPTSRCCPRVRRGTPSSRCAELSNLKLRRSEKRVLNEVNHSEGQRHRVMDPARPDKILERIASGADKIFILVRAGSRHASAGELLRAEALLAGCTASPGHGRRSTRYTSPELCSCPRHQVNAGLSDRPPDKLDYSLKCDMEQAASVGARLAAAMVRYFTHAGRASETFNSLLLLKSLRQRLWPGSTHESRQLPGIGPTISGAAPAALPASVLASLRISVQPAATLTDPRCALFCPPTRRAACGGRGALAAPARGRGPPPPGEHGAAPLPLWQRGPRRAAPADAAHRPGGVHAPGLDARRPAGPGDPG